MDMVVEVGTEMEGLGWGGYRRVAGGTFVEIKSFACDNDSKKQRRGNMFKMFTAAAAG